MAEDQNAIRREIEGTREEMAETIDAIGYKADVPSRAKDRLTAVRENVAEKTDSVLSSVKGAAQRVTGGANDTMTQTQTTLSDNASQVTDKARSGVREGVRVAQDNPLVLVVGAVAAGFLIGSMLPKTRMEEEKIGPTAERVKSQAMAKGEEAIERVGERAKSALDQTADRADSTLDEARSGGSTGTTTGSYGTYGSTRTVE